MARDRRRRYWHGAAVLPRGLRAFADVACGRWMRPKTVDSSANRRQRHSDADGDWRTNGIRLDLDRRFAAVRYRRSASSDDAYDEHGAQDCGDSDGREQAACRDGTARRRRESTRREPSFGLTFARVTLLRRSQKPRRAPLLQKADGRSHSAQRRTNRTGSSLVRVRSGVLEARSSEARSLN